MECNNWLVHNDWRTWNGSQVAPANHCNQVKPNQVNTNTGWVTLTLQKFGVKKFAVPIEHSGWTTVWTFVVVVVAVVVGCPLGPRQTHLPLWRFVCLSNINMASSICNGDRKQQKEWFKHVSTIIMVMAGSSTTYSAKLLEIIFNIVNGGGCGQATDKHFLCSGHKFGVCTLGKGNLRINLFQCGNGGKQCETWTITIEPMEWLLTFLPSNSCGPLTSTLSTLDESANVTKPKPLFKRESRGLMEPIHCTALLTEIVWWWGPSSPLLLLYHQICWNTLWDPLQNERGRRNGLVWIATQLDQCSSVKVTTKDGNTPNQSVNTQTARQVLDWHSADGCCWFMCVSEHH